MKTLILYGTTEGQTRKICEFVAKRLRDIGDAVTLVDATGDATLVDLRAYDVAIIAASLHSGQYQSSVTQFVRTNHTGLNLMPSAFISVSLSAAGTDPEDLSGIAECAERFKADANWTTPPVHQVAGAFRFTEYDFFKRWVLKLIAWKKGVEIEPGKDVEFTNWDALAATVDAMRARFAGMKPTAT